MLCVSKLSLHAYHWDIEIDDGFVDWFTAVTNIWTASKLINSKVSTFLFISVLTDLQSQQSGGNNPCIYTPTFADQFCLQIAIAN